MYILVHGKYGPTSFIMQHAFFSALRVQCVWFTISDSPIRTVVNHTCQTGFVRVIGGCSFHYTKLRFNN